MRAFARMARLVGPLTGLAVIAGAATAAPPKGAAESVVSASVPDDVADGDGSELAELASLEAPVAVRALAAYGVHADEVARLEAAATREPLYGKDRVPPALRSPSTRVGGARSGPARKLSGDEIRAALGGADPESLAALGISMEWRAPILAYVDFFLGKGRKLITRWVARSGRYFPMMERTFAEAGLPLDLLYLSFIESGLNPKALSSASASGLWQFMPVTGGVYGLVSDYWIDERRIPERATEAAAIHLRALHERFGSWDLALAAYNCGGGLMATAIRRYGTNDFWELARYEALPAQTRSYVPKFFAVAIIASNLKAFGFDEIERDPELDYDLGHVPGSISVEVIARAAGVPTTDIEELNPELKRCCTPPDRTEYTVRLPLGTAKRFGETIPKVWPKSKLEFVHHVVKLGDTLKGISRRYGTSIPRIRSMNSVRKDSDLEPGRVLVVPRKAGLPPVRLASAETTTDVTPVLALVPDEEFRYADRKVAFYVVRPSDDLAGIASILDVRPADVVLWNGLDPESELMTGMVLRLYLKKGAGTGAHLLSSKEVTVLKRGSDEYLTAVRGRSVPLPGKLHYAGPGAPGGSGYTVRKGDSLWIIAKRFSVTVAAIKSANGFHGKDPMLSIGQRIIIPGKSTPSKKK